MAESSKIEKVVAAKDGVVLAQRADGVFVVGICLIEGQEHFPLDYGDFYLGTDAAAAERVFMRYTTTAKEDGNASRT